MSVNAHCARRYLCTLGVLCSLSALIAQTQQPPAPLFTSRIDLLTAQASIFDKDGQPVADLTPADFIARVDGKPRNVVFARFYGSRGHQSPEPASLPLPSEAFVSNAAIAPGRVVVLAIDQESIRSGQEKAALETASKFVDTLAPTDAVGLLGLPDMAVNLTRDHARVREALVRIVGTEHLMPWARNVSLDEATKIDEGDRRTRVTVIERECPYRGDSLCSVDIVNQAREMVRIANVRIQTTLTRLGELVARLKTVRGPKHVVFISGGLPFGLQSLGMYRDFARSAGEAQVVVYTIHLDQASFDASDRKQASSAFGGRDLALGLSNLASITGGAFYNGVAAMTGVFARISTEINNFYELGIESVAGDIEGKSHDLELKVVRQGLSVRSRRDVIVPVRSSSRPDEFLELLYQPLNVNDLPLAVATCVLRGDEANTLDVLISADIGLGAAIASPVQWGFAVVANDKVVTSHRQSASAMAGKALVDTVSATLAPGQYRLRVAALDAARRGGMLETPLAVRLHAAGSIQMSDLIIGAGGSARFEPAARVARASGIVAVAQLYADDRRQFEGVEAQLELASDSGVHGMPMEVKAAAARTTMSLEARVRTADFTPGRYVATAVVRVGGRPVGKVSRAIEIVP